MRSWPAEKCLPSAASTIDADVVVGLGAVERGVELVISCVFCAFAASGRSSVIVATAPSTSYRIVWSTITPGRRI